MPENHPIENTSSGRKLASILFADIAGYTALMQKDQSAATTLLRKFHETMKSQVEAFKGSIVNEMGDGMLCTFEVPTDSVRCAMALKKAFEEAPTVPVRLGIHSGIVMFEGGKVYGDSVNVASRIESIGVPGAVLISNRVRRDIKNQTDIQTASLGSFHFKNVDEPMEVYAIANEGFMVPNRKELKGKFVGEKGIGSKSFFTAIVVTIIAIASAVYFYKSTDSSSTSQESIPEEILNERVAVVPFKNLTNDPSLDIMGDIATNWVNQSLMNLEDAEVTSPFTVQSNIASLGILPNDASGRPSFSELTGAQNIISGTYFMDKDRLVYALNIQDALSGKLHFTFPHIQGEMDDKQGMIDQISEHVVGYWAAREMVDSKKIKAPKYEAYELFMEDIRERTWETLSRSNLPRILAIDSTFYWPRIYFLSLNKIGLFGDNIPHFKFLDRHYEKLSNYEKAWFDFFKGMYSGQPKLAFNSLNKIREIYPKDFILNYEVGYMALEGINNPELAINIYDQLPIEESTAPVSGITYHKRIRIYARSLLRLNRLDEAKSFLNPYRSYIGFGSEDYYQALIHEAMSGQISIQKRRIIFDTFNKLKDRPFSLFYIISSIIFSNLIDEDIRSDLHNELLQYYNNLGPDHQLRFLYKNTVALLTNDPSKIDLNNLDQMPKVYQITNLAYAGSVYEKIGAVPRLDYILKELEKRTYSDYSSTTAWGSGLAHYWIAKFQVKMGQYDEAIKNLTKSRNAGIMTMFDKFQYDKDLTPLFNRPDFQELTKAIWPDLKD